MKAKQAALQCQKAAVAALKEMEATKLGCRGWWAASRTRTIVDGVAVRSSLREPAVSIGVAILMC